MSRAKESQFGQLHFLADAELDRFRVVCPGSDNDHVAYPTAVTDRPEGILPEGCTGAEDHIAVRRCGYGETATLKISGTLSKGDLVCPAIDGTGKGRALPASGQVYAFARALEDALDGQEIAVETFAPALVDAALGTSSRLRALVETVAYGDFTDGGSTSGTVNLSNTLPAGAKPLGGKVVVSTGFTGDTSAALDVGTAGDPDAFVDNVDVLSADTVWGAASDESLLLAETTVQVTVTGAADFTSVSAGVATIYVFYLALA
jgi:hypothetical protein